MTHRIIQQAVAWSFLLLLTAWMAINIYGYLPNPEGVPFYSERISTAPNGWGGMLRIHIAGGAVCLVTGPILFWKWAGRIAGVHAICGALYGVAALGVMIPTAFWLSASAHGGRVGQAGFWLTALLTAGTTLLGFHHLVSGQAGAHVAWMTRSYALMTSALTFRLVYLIQFWMGVPYGVNYPLSTWLSTIVNLLLAEWLLYTRYSSFTTLRGSHDNLPPHSSPSSGFAPFS